VGYVGNPHLTFTDLSPPVVGSQGLAAYLDGTASCGKDGFPYLNVKWTNPAQAGHLSDAGSLFSFSRDNFTNQATQEVFLSQLNGYPALVNDEALARYTPDATLLGLSDNVVADFFPDLANPPAAKACLAAAGAGLFVQDELAAVWDNSQTKIQDPSPTVFLPAKKITQTYTVPLSDPGGYTVKGAKASVTVTPNGPGKWTVTLIAGGANPNYPNNNPQPGSGPFRGRAVIDLIVINPGPAGKAKVNIDGQVQNANFCQPEPPGVQACTLADGGVVVTDSQGKTVESGSLNLIDKKPVGPFPVAADSSCSAEMHATPACPHPNPVRISVIVTEAVVIAPSPATFSVTLNIEAVNQ